MSGTAEKKESENSGQNRLFRPADPGKQAAGNGNDGPNCAKDKGQE